MNQRTGDWGYTPQPRGPMVLEFKTLGGQKREKGKSVRV